MSTEKNVLDRLVPLQDPDLRPEFVEEISRPTHLVKPTRGERLHQVLEEGFYLGELGIAVGVFGALIVTGEMSRPLSVVLAALSAFLSARMLTAFLGDRVAAPGVGLLAGMVGTLMAWVMACLGLLFLSGSVVDKLHVPMELLKVAWLLQPFRFCEFLLIGGGFSALVTFVARWKLEQRPWVSGTLPSQKGRKVWKGLTVALSALVAISLLASPSSQERRSANLRPTPLASALERALEQQDFVSADRILDAYPGALEWYNYGSKVTFGAKNLEAARYVVERGGDFTGGAGYRSVLEQAAKLQNDPLLEFLLAHGADPNEGSRLPLVTAVELRHLYAVQVLLDKGADPMRSDIRGSALEVAERAGDQKLLHALKDAL